MPGSGGHLSSAPEDFVVEERLPYVPSGHGSHLFVFIEKRRLTSLEAARQLARHFESGGGPADMGAVGIAGLKDRHAQARQWLSFPWPEERPLPKPDVVRDASSSLVLLEAIRHPHKLRRGHVAGNHFQLRVRGVPRGGTRRAERILDRLRTIGVPNPFGLQRFGVEGDNAERARSFLAGKSRPPRDRRLYKLLLSALQSEIFNTVLDIRLAEDLLQTALVGDRMVKHASGGQFLVEDADREQPRVDRLEISPTGPLFGRGPQRVLGRAAEIEAQALTASGLGANEVRGLGPGSRRPLRYPLDPDARLEAVFDEGPEESYQLSVTLPAGAYATALLDELVKPVAGPLRRAPDPE